MDESVPSYIDPKVPEYGIRLQYTSFKNCTETEMYGFTLDIRCDENAINPIPRIVSKSVAENSCNPRVYLESSSGKNFSNNELGCISTSFNKVWQLS